MLILPSIYSSISIHTYDEQKHQVNFNTIKDIVQE